MDENVDSDETRTPQSADMITMGYGHRSRRRLPNHAALASVAVFALAGGAGVGYAATHSSAQKPSDTAAAALSGAAAAASTPTTGPSLTPPSGPGGSAAPSFRGAEGRHSFIFGGFPGGLGPMVGGVVHGQVVVPKSGGGYQTLDLQTGKVTAVSPTSITVKSSDGYTASYAVTGSTIVDAKSAGIGSVKTGDTVNVSATVSGSTATAASIMDSTAISSGRVSFGFPAMPAKPANPPS